MSRPSSPTTGTSQRAPGSADLLIGPAGDGSRSKPSSSLGPSRVASSLAILFLLFLVGCGGGGGGGLDSIAGGGSGGGGGDIVTPTDPGTGGSEGEDGSALVVTTTSIGLEGTVLVEQGTVSRTGPGVEVRVDGRSATVRTVQVGEEYRWSITVPRTSPHDDFRVAVYVDGTFVDSYDCRISE